MTTPPTVLQLTYNWSADRKGNKVVAIIAHNTVGSDSRAYLSRGGDAPDGSDRRVSVHSLIRKDGTLYRYVPDELGANHAGFGKLPNGYPQINPNFTTIGFELENASDGRALVDPYTDTQLLTMGWEINRIRAKFGALPIFRHADIDPDRRRDTAGLSIVQIEQWANAAAVVYGFGVPAPAVPPPADPFARWGSVGKPTGAAAGYAVPRAWLVNKALGQCVVPETYAASGAYSVTEFERGLITYLKARNTTVVEMFV